MLSEGAMAPAVELPAYVDERRERVDLADFLGEGIVVLAFYPADFNPACSMQTSDLGDLDLFTMQKDVAVFAVSPDSTYSHEAFAERFSLNVPLLSDVDGAATAAYDVAMETATGERLPQRAVFVVDHHGEVRYAWATDDLDERIDVDPVKRAVGDVGGDETAFERYRAGFEQYAAGREAFTAAMAEYEEREWIPARGGFDEAEPAFTAAADHFDTAVRFAETPAFETVVDRAEEKADALQHAANWLGDSADAFGGGRGKQGSEYRQDAERLLDAASDLAEPPDPDLFTLTDDGVALDDAIVVDSHASDDGYELADGESEAVDTDLDLDLDEAALDADDGNSGDADADGAAGDGTPADTRSVEGDAVEGDLEMDLSVVESEPDDGGDGGDVDHGTAPSDGDAGAAAGTSPAAVAGDGAHGSAAERTADAADDADETDDAGGGDDGDDVEELELADPTDPDDEDDDDRSDWNIPGR